MTKEFDGKVVLITGAGSGIGRAAAYAFAKQGARLALIDINAAGIEETAASVGDFGAEALAIHCDVTSAGQVCDMVEKVVGRFGTIDVAFNNAGVDQDPAPLVDQDEATYEKVMDVNVRGVWLCMQQELKVMLPKGQGTIVNTSSIADTIGAPAMQFYAASKHAVLGLTRAVALECIASGVRINAVAPGGVLTNMLRELDKRVPGTIAASEAAHPIGRMASEDEIVDAVLFLASDRSSFIVGQSVKVDGGYTVP